MGVCPFISNGYPTSIVGTFNGANITGSSSLTGTANGSVPIAQTAPIVTGVDINGNPTQSGGGTSINNVPLSLTLAGDVNIVSNQMAGTINTVVDHIVKIQCLQSECQLWSVEEHNCALNPPKLNRVVMSPATVALIQSKVNAIV
jgi:hypothetical protein